MAERVQQVKGPGARPPRGVKPQVKNPMKIFTRIMKYALKDYTVHCIAVVIAIFVNVLANVQGTMFMKTLIDGYITPMLTQPDPDFGPLLHAILRDRYCGCVHSEPYHDLCVPGNPAESGK